MLYTNDHRPAHVHVWDAGRQALFNLNCPAGPVELRENFGFPWSEVNELARLLQPHVPALCARCKTMHGLAGAPRSKLASIEISPNGLGLHWPLLDADLYVPALIEGTFGSLRWMQQIGKLGGSRRSPVKAKASRENGKRGGRPKHRAAA